MLKKYRLDLTILIPLILLMTISIISIAGAEKLLMTNEHFMIKQLLWYLVGFGIIFIIMFIGNKLIISNVWILYIINNIFLALLLVFAKPINNSKCWFQIPGIGGIQPSEFMKIILIITIAKMINEALLLGVFT